MVKFKKIDVYGQYILIIASLVNALFQNTTMILYSYFLVGGWQIASTILQMCFNKKWPERYSRNAYQLFLAIVLLTIPLGTLWVLPVIAPFAAIWYLYISYRELRTWEARQLIQFR